MTTEKRGSEKLLDAEGGLCSLTAEELSQVAGAVNPNVLLKPFDLVKPIDVVWPGDSFPLGTVNPDLFKQLVDRSGLLNRR